VSVLQQAGWDAASLENAVFDPELLAVHSNQGSKMGIRLLLGTG